MHSYQYALLGILLLAPAFAQAQAYLGPEDVLYLNVQSQRLNPRSAEKSVQERQANEKAYVDPRPTLHEWWEQPSDDTASVDETVVAHPAAGEPPVTVTVPSGTTDGLHSGAGIDPITLRLLQRLQQQPTYVTVPADYVYQTKHLAHTGPESIVAILAMLPAGFYVVRRARKMEKFLR